jgi:hypothetical protein
MKINELNIGDKFKVAVACNPEELEDSWEILEIKKNETEIRGRTILLSCDTIVRSLSSGKEGSMKVGAWVELIKL